MCILSRLLDGTPRRDGRPSGTTPAAQLQLCQFILQELDIGLRIPDLVLRLLDDGFVLGGCLQCANVGVGALQVLAFRGEVGEEFCNLWVRGLRGGIRAAGGRRTVVRGL